MELASLARASPYSLFTILDGTDCFLLTGPPFLLSDLDLSAISIRSSGLYLNIFQSSSNPILQRHFLYPLTGMVSPIHFLFHRRIISLPYSQGLAHFCFLGLTV